MLVDTTNLNGMSDSFDREIRDALRNAIWAYYQISSSLSDYLWFSFLYTIRNKVLTIERVIDCKETLC